MVSLEEKENSFRGCISRRAEVGVTAEMFAQIDLLRVFHRIPEQREQWSFIQIVLL